MRHMDTLRGAALGALQQVTLKVCRTVLMRINLSNSEQAALQ